MSSMRLCVGLIRMRIIIIMLNEGRLKKWLIVIYAGSPYMKVNSYFSNQVLSIDFVNSNGTSSVGVMEPGFFQFTTSRNERIIVTSGALLIQRLNDPEPLLFSDGEEFNIPKNQSFEVEVSEQTSYLCKYS